ncbi:hypothetical protein J6590_100719 [Homalodisca vitripennis]|nr:hypothetical protein J6590_100719 [Homalodisca vitripennis]
MFGVILMLFRGVEADLEKLHYMRISKEQKRRRLGLANSGAVRRHCYHIAPLLTNTSHNILVL